ncbi:mitochondrial import inner membrane translocase subunit Tim21-like [Syngnathus typhle]|uniref:mitochondrial import inner membrane translocase subunit Tim21-like n=1 Tax=Syngnathus typhle TaxID=161592 RepID=UPI002A6B4D6A|nr:mitochondrial import inner membrane translocase subunit Tim21-like [Syngnathus typhle]XP_061121504.1 mitochondrial import inner membrane translocase subunit Tim21-like [Syngnathus typhle]
MLRNRIVMAYMQILKILHRNLKPTATQTCRLTSGNLFPHTHRAESAYSSVTFHGRLEPFACSCHALCCILQSRRGITLGFRARNKNEDRDDGHKSLYKYQSGSSKLSATRKVKKAGRDFTYLIVVLIGLGVTGGLLYVVFQELFSSSSPNKVYGKAFNKVRLDPEVIGAFGEPIKCYGETTRRRRRQQISHMEYLKDGLKHMRLKFYIEGSEPGLKGTVHSESKENPETGKYEFRYIFVDVDTYPRRTIIVEDNR